MREGFLRNFVFGIEDALVSTVGFVSGIAATSVERTTLLSVGFILITVEGFSMAVGSFLSDESVREWRHRRIVTTRPSVFGALIMLISYIGAGLLVLMPYLVWPDAAMAVSIAISLCALFLLGVFSARLAHLNALSRGLRMAGVGGLAILFGILVARGVGLS